MNYQEIIEKIARENNITADDADREIRLAISYTGLETEPEEFIKMLADRVKKKMDIK